MTGSRRPAGSRASIRVRAALAGGLVFGIAAGLTVASWTDAEYSKGTFTASVFDLETNVNNGGYSNAATASITVSGVYPGTSGRLYVPVLVRTTSNSAAGTVSLTHTAVASPTGLTAVLQHRIVQTTSTCAATAFTAASTYVVGSNTVSVPVATGLASSSSLPVAAASAGVVGYCFEFSLAATGLTQATYQGTSTVPLTWQLPGVST